MTTKSEGVEHCSDVGGGQDASLPQTEFGVTVRNEDGTASPNRTAASCLKGAGASSSTPGLRMHSNFSPLAVALLLDEWRRATLEGQGGFLVRLPRERYDGVGNLWSVVRRATDSGERIVLTCEKGQYRAMAYSNELRQLEPEAYRLNRSIELTGEELDRAERKKDELRCAKLRESLEAYAKSLRGCRERIAEIKGDEFEQATEEWEFPLDLSGVGISLTLG